MRALAISGSLRQGSWNTTLLRAAAALLPPGDELVVHEGLGIIPPFSEDEEHDPHDSVRALREAIAHSDALLVATPEYNHSLPGVLKNAVDWLSRPVETTPLRNKPVAVLGVSTGLFGAVWAQAEARKVLAASGAAVLDRELPVGLAEQAFNAEGGLIDPALRDELVSILAALHAACASPAS